MADKFERRLGLLGLASDGGDIQKAMRQRVQRNYGSPVKTQQAAETTPTKETTNLPSHSTSSSKLEKRLKSLFLSELEAPTVDESEKDSSATLSSTGSTSSTPAPSTSAFDTELQPPSSITMPPPPQTRSIRPVVGMPALVGEVFCAFLATSKLPYKFIFDKHLGQLISEAFFADGKFFRHGWTIYYIYPTSNSSKPLFLVPQSEVHAFVQLINGAFPQAGLSLGRLSSRFDGLTIQFRSKHSQLRPRFLGVINTHEQYDRIRTDVPGCDFKVPGLPVERELDEDDPEVQHYEIQLFQALDLGGNKKKGSSKKATPQVREERQNQMRIDFKDNLEMVERFLGLRASKPKGVSASSDWASNSSRERSWEEERAELARIAALKAPPAAVDYNKSPAFPFHSNVVFVCLDVEAYEKDNSKITEIGISTLDTKNLEGVAPGQAGSDWRNKIRARHFRIQEHSHLRNGTFVHDNAANFKFGSSEFIPLGEAPKTVAACFRGSDSTIVAQDNKRTIVLVGHDVEADVRFLLRMGYDVTNLSTLHPSNPVVDTQKLFRAYQKIKKPSMVTTGQQPVSLAVVMEELDIAPFGLHNAGNDAAYTMQVMIGMAVESAQLRQNAAVANEDWNGDLNAFKKPAEPEEDVTATWQTLDEAGWA